jgi:hypothetical protein
MSLVNRSDRDQQQEVPRVEIQGEEVVINRPDANNQEKPQERKKLPKNTWE